MRLKSTAMMWLFVFAGLCQPLLSASDSSSETEHPTTPKLQFELIDLQGKSHNLGQNDAKVVRVFVFVSITCPVSNSYTKELNRLATQFANKTSKVEFFGVVSAPYVTRAEATQHFADYQATFPILFDDSGLLADALQPTHVPEVFVLDRRGTIVYREAIDNAYVSIGRRRANVEHHYLKDAMRSVVSNVKVEISNTTPVGCHFPKVKRVDQDASVTYCRNIAPLIQTRCQNCHRPGQVAPFSLTNYAEVAAHGEMLVEVTQQQIMPPWMPGSKTDYQLVGERKLTEREREMIKVWVEAGCPQGDEADLPPNPQFSEGWQLGEPDLIVKMPEPFSVPAEGPDLFHNFVLPIDIPEDKLVAAVEFHPGNKRVVHHAVLFLDDKGAARKLDEATPEPGYSNFGGPGFLPSGALGGWSVGNTARRLPNEMGRYLKKGSDLVVQVHYHPTGKAEVDQSELGLFFVDKPVAESLKLPAKLVGSIWLANYEMDIPAGAANYRRTTSYTLPKDVILVGIVPHMHLLGKSMKATAHLPDGSTRTLIDVPDWNYNWQDEYYYERPFKIPAGTRLTVEAVFDNSAANPSNPSSPPRRVTWGEETTDEMLFCFFLIAAEETEDLIHTIFDNLQHDIEQTRKPVEGSP
ncbi:MAG: redoxin family protein [Planctomycetaceae bacterium]|nr:redoxin family protein [bacterium]MDG2391344.1 redoxin family protein [Planctomycetaceae bacterium]